MIEPMIPDGAKALLEPLPGDRDLRTSILEILGGLAVIVWLFSWVAAVCGVLFLLQIVFGFLELDGLTGGVVLGGE